MIHHAKTHPESHSVYAAVGTKHGIQPVVSLLEREGVLEQFTVVVAGKNDSEAAKYLAPYGACAGECIPTAWYLFFDLSLDHQIIYYTIVNI